MDYGYYLIAFLDLLGQRPRLRELRELPTSQEDLARTVEVLRHTAGVVLWLRDAFDKLIQEYTKPAGLIATLPTDKRQLAQELAHCKVEYRGFSDSLIIAVQLANNDDHCTPMNGVYGCLFGAAALFTLALAKRHPLRGGIDVGLGLRLSKGEVYGPALERAYSLETSVAGYPRVVIGEELWTYLREVESQPTSTLHARLASQIANECQRLIAQDSDGYRVLDYMGDAVRLAVPDEIATQVEQAYRFVISQCRHWRAERSDKLLHRYDCVRAYMESRLANWGLQPQPGEES